MSVSGKIGQIAGLATYPTNLMWSAASGMVARKFWREELSEQGWLNTYRACEFTSELHTHAVRPYWWHSFKNMREDVSDYLELGSWEGQSTVFSGWLFPGAKITAVDWFANAQANDRFDRNTAFLSKRLEKIKGTTVDILMRFTQEGRTFDFIYIDADHRFDGVLLDTILSWPLLRGGGYLVWDDYLWTHPAIPHLNPKTAIDAWLTSRRDSIDVVFAGYQVCVQKIADDTQITDMAYWD